MPSLVTDALRRDIAGGLVSSAIAIPLAIGFGMFAFVTLGDEYFAYGAVAGLISALVASVVSVLLGDRSINVYAPRINTTFFLGLLLYSLLNSDRADVTMPSVSSTLVVFFAIVLFGGLFQALFGLMRLGTLIKFAPHPVMAGFQNMAAVLLFVVQLGNVLGFDDSIGFTRVFSHMGAAHPLSILVAAVTFAAMWNARRITTKVPPLLVGLGVGVAVYYGLVLAGLSHALGPVIGMPTASASMRSVLVDFSGLTMAAPLKAFAPVILSGALALAIIASIDALLCAKLASQPGDPRIDGDRLLIRLGLGSAVAAGFGGITNGINIGASTTNRAFGGHSWISVAVNAAMLLAAVTLLFPVIAHLPRVVLSAVIMVVAVQHIDPWTKQLTARLFKHGTPQRGVIALDLAVAMFVSVLSIAVHVVLAVFIGIALAVFLFVVRMSRSNIRRLYRCDAVRSRRARNSREIAVLESEGGATLVVELQGALFFGSAESLAQIIDTETVSNTKVVILGMRRITEIDSTGARILGDINAALARRNIKLALVRSDNSETAARLAEVPVGEGRIFPDVDHAIEWAEEELLGKPAAAPAQELTLDQIPILQKFSGEQTELLRRHLIRMSWPAGHTIFRQGEPGSDLFLVLKGRASVYLTTAGPNIRLITFAPGSVFGELAILDQGRRAATIVADEDMEAFALSASAFGELGEREPEVAIKLLTALGRELSDRLRRANRTIHELET